MNTQAWIEAYTDGACKGNPGVGGWGVWLKYAEHEKSLCGGEALTTNNRMELTAVIEAFKTIKKVSNVRIYTDSSYVQKGMTEWIQGWKAKQWKTASKKPVKNEDLWKILDQLSQVHRVEWVWIKGHAGHEGNEKADALANQGVLLVT